MDSDGVPDISTGINYEEVDALSQKRIIAFFNEFVGHTVTFLNKFSSECEEKLFTVDTRLEKLETMLSILEAKLSSVPGLASSSQKTPHSTIANSESAKPNGSPQPDNESETSPSVGQSATTQHTNGQSAPPQPSGDQSAAAAAGTDQLAAGLVCLRQAEPYKRYFRMLEVGVPEPAVRIKMQQDGVDPDILQRGGELVPDPSTSAARGSSESDESEAASWASGASGS